MPYIKQEERDQIDPALEQLCIALASIEIDHKKVATTYGMLNYVITRLLTLHNGVAMFPNYDTINSLIGVLECAKIELYRRIAVPYEKSKMEENGDVYP